MYRPSLAENTQHMDTAFRECLFTPDNEILSGARKIYPSTVETAY